MVHPLVTRVVYEIAPFLISLQHQRLIIILLCTVGLDYLGVDIAIDAAQGPMLLEANARPGLAIQIANARGLITPLAEIDELKEALSLGLRERKTKTREQEPLRKSA